MVFGAVDESNVITLGVVVSALAGVIVWILKVAAPALLKQYRDDLMQQQASWSVTLKEVVAEFRQENRLRDDRHDRELTRRDAALDKLTTVVDRLADQVEELRDGTGEHRAAGG